MYKLWPSPILFAIAAMLFFQGQQKHQEAVKVLSNQPDLVARIKAESDLSTGHYMQIGAGVLVAVGVILIGVGLIYGWIQKQGLKHSLAATYSFVPLIPVEGSVPEAGLLTEDQAADLLRTRYPSLAKGATETLKREFADKRRLEPTKIWYVKDFLVREVAAPSA